MGLLYFSHGSEAPPGDRLDFERTTNLPSGVSPLFPVLFLAGSLAAFVYFQLARRRMYRLSYLPSTLPSELSRDGGSHAQQILQRMHEYREDIDQLIAKPARAITRVNPILLFTLIILFALFFIRLYFRGPARSFEGSRFDWTFCIAFVVTAVIIVLRALQLLAVWAKTRSMLQLTVDLPMAQAFDRIPERLKGWFFGSEDFGIRKQLVLRQGAALKERSTEELATMFKTIFPGEGEAHWDKALIDLREALEDREGTLDSTRAVYPFLDRIWDALPVEEVPRQSRADKDVARPAVAGGGATSWPLVPRDRPKITAVGHEILRDWVRMAEDLVALQIVRWFAPALSQLLPIMKFLVIGPLLLLLALTSYPFDHQGWMMAVMVTIILFVGGVVSVVLIGVNRDELISRVSDTTPGRLSLDGGIINLTLTTIGPLLAALLAISFDLSDLLHTWFGPIFQLL